MAQKDLSGLVCNFLPVFYSRSATLLAPRVVLGSRVSCFFQKSGFGIGYGVPVVCLRACGVVAPSHNLGLTLQGGERPIAIVPPSSMSLRAMVNKVVCHHDMYLLVLHGMEDGVGGEGEGLRIIIINFSERNKVRYIKMLINRAGRTQTSKRITRETKPKYPFPPYPEL